MKQRSASEKRSLVFCASYLSGPLDPCPYMVNTLLWTTEDRRLAYINRQEGRVRKAELRFTSYDVSSQRVSPETMKLANTGRPVVRRGSPFGDYRNNRPPEMRMAAQLDEMEKSGMVIE